MVSKTHKSAKKTTKVSTAVKKYVEKKIDSNTEDKYNIINMTAGGLNSIPSTWVEVNGCTPAQGVSKNQRIGTKIRVKSIEINTVISEGSNGTAVDDQYNIMRVVIGKYTGQTAAPLITAGVGFNDPIKKDWSDARGTLVQKLVDRYIPLAVASTEKGGGDGYTPTLKKFKYYKRFKNFVITFADDSINYPNYRLIMSFISDSAVVTNPGFVAGYAVVRFEDA